MCLDVMTDAVTPRRLKLDLETFIKEHGGTVSQSATVHENVIVLADRGNHLLSSRD
jgi:hypothetical protein